MATFQDVKRMVLDLGLSIKQEIPEEELIVVEDEERGIKNMIVDCEGEILIIEQPIGKVKEKYYGWFLEKNRELPFGAFALDSENKIIVFRQTLRLDTLDMEELESTINSIEMFLAEHGDELLKILKEGCE
ncbi:YbjN domain-containing protein [Archaeoglobus sp.]